MAGMRAVAIAFAGLLLTPAAAVGQSSFITLGTGGGPAPQARRAQPANLLLSRDQAILIDCGDGARSEEHTSELQSLMRNSYAVFCLKKKIKRTQVIKTYIYNT